jgi:acyl-CoA dehydrogenase
LTLSNAIRSLVMASTLARFSYVPETGSTKRFYQHINRFSASFAFAVDVSMLTLGGYLKKKESISARLGDVLSYLYLASMVLKHYENQGRPADDLPLVEWSCRTLLYQAQEQLHGVIQNFPNRLIAALMRGIVFPRGRTYSAPSDNLAAQIVASIMTPCETRERLTDGTYKTLEPTNALGLLQEVLVLAQSTEPLERKLRVDGVKTGKVTALDLPGQIDQGESLGILTAAEATLLRDYDQKVMNIVNVDDFDTGEMAAGRV